VLVRSDSAGASHGFVDAIAERGLEFSVGFDVTEPAAASHHQDRDQPHLGSGSDSWVAR
jgi:hypothetical protein